MLQSRMVFTRDTVCLFAYANVPVLMCFFLCLQIAERRRNMPIREQKRFDLYGQVEGVQKQGNSL